MERGLWLPQRALSERRYITVLSEHACMNNRCSPDAERLVCNFSRRLKSLSRGLAEVTAYLSYSGRGEAELCRWRQCAAAENGSSPGSARAGPAGGCRADRSRCSFCSSSRSRRLGPHCVFQPCRSALWARPPTGRWAPRPPWSSPPQRPIAAPLRTGVYDLGPDCLPGQLEPHVSLMLGSATLSMSLL